MSILENSLSLWELLLTAAGFVATVVSLLLIYFQLRATRLIASADFTLKLCYDIFHSNRMIEKRKRLAEILSSEPKNFEKIDAEARDPIDFFDDVGLLLKAGIVQKDFVWTSLRYWILFYWVLVEEYVRWSRKTNPLFFVDYEYLVHEMLKIEAKKKKEIEAKKTPEDILDELKSNDELKLFLESEKNL